MRYIISISTGGDAFSDSSADEGSSSIISVSTGGDAFSDSYADEGSSSIISISTGVGGFFSGPLVGAGLNSVPSAAEPSSVVALRGHIVVITVTSISEMQSEKRIKLSFIRLERFTFLDSLNIPL